MMKSMALAMTVFMASGAANAGVGGYVDAKGDEVRPFDEKAHAHDVATIDAYFDLAANTMVVDVTFHSLITPVGRGQSGFNPDLVMFLGFDIDNDANTGDKPLQNSLDDLFTPLNLGVDMEIALVPFGPSGHVEVITLNDHFVAPVEFFAQRLVATIDLDDLLAIGVTPGEYGFAGIFGTGLQPTDASDSIGLTRVVPTPGAGALLALSGLAVASRRRR